MTTPRAFGADAERFGVADLHLPMVAGIILLALGTKKTLAHIDEPLSIVGATPLAALIPVAQALRFREVRDRVRHAQEVAVS